METGQIRTFSELSDIVIEFDDGDWIFRGVIDAGYQLVPKAARREYLKARGRGSPEERPYDPREEREYLLRFQSKAKPFVSYHPLDDNTIEWMTIAQHHGLPTRMLDWTTSPLVAAYFAVLGSGVKGEERVDAAIFAMDCNELAPIHEGEHGPFEIDTDGIYWPPHISPRVGAQSAVLTVSANPPEPMRSRSLRRWIIPSGSCFEIRRQLDFCGVTTAAMFPDLDGLARHLGWCYKWLRR